jgi:drug/metabolite transporter (DMT)-like permease
MEQMMNRRTVISMRSWIVYGAMCLIFGTTFLAIKIGSNEGIPPFLAAGVRFTTAGAILIVVRGASKRAGNALRDGEALANGRYLVRALVLGVLIIGITFAMTYSAAEYIGSGQIAQIHSVSPIVIALLSAVVLGYRLHRPHYVGLSIGLVGALLLVNAAGDAGTHALLGALLAFGAEFSYGVGSIWFRKAFGDGTDSVLTNGFSMFFGGLFLLILAFVTGQTDVALTPRAVASLAYLIVVGSIGGHSMYLWLVGTVSPLFASTWLFVSPAIATLLGAVVLGESITVWNVVGIGAILSGVYAIQSGERRRVSTRRREKTPAR